MFLKFYAITNERVICLLMPNDVSYINFYAITNPAIVTLSNFLLDVYYINFMQSPTLQVSFRISLLMFLI